MRRAPLFVPPRRLAPSLLALLALLVTPLAAGCGCDASARVAVKDPAFVAAVTRICEVDQRAGLDADADLLGVGPKRSAWIAANVDNPDAIELRTYMSVKGATDQATLLRDRARSLGIARCPLADSMAKLGEGGLAP